MSRRPDPRQEAFWPRPSALSRDEAPQEDCEPVPPPSPPTPLGTNPGHDANGALRPAGRHRFETRDHASRVIADWLDRYDASRRTPPSARSQVKRAAPKVARYAIRVGLIVVDERLE